MIEAISIYTNKIKLPKEKFKLRVSAYGIIKNKNKILLVEMKSSKKLFFPGGGVEIGEKLEDTIKREAMEETGIKVEIERFLTFKETFFYYDHFDQAFQNYSFFYICKPKNFILTEENQIEFDESTKPKWIHIDKLKKDDFQPPANEIFELLK